MIVVPGGRVFFSRTSIDSSASSDSEAFSDLQIAIQLPDPPDSVAVKF
jgi:hypothetical protein